MAGIGGDRARRALEEHLAPWRPVELRITAAQALATLGDPAAVPALDAAWPGPDERGARELEQALAVALAKLGQARRMLPRLAADLTDPALSPIPSREGLVAWLEELADDDPWARARLAAIPPIGQDATPLDAFWEAFAADESFRSRVAAEAAERRP